MIAELRKSFLVRGLRPPLWFWRTSAGDEIDALVEIAPERFLAIECKTAARVDASALRSLRALRAEYGEDCTSMTFVVCRTERAYPLTEDLTAEAVALAGRGGLLNRPELGP